MTKSKYPCPICGGGGNVVTEIVSTYPTKVYGVEFDVSKARIGRCDKCNEGFISAQEMKRWRILFYKTLTDKMKIRLIGADADGFLEGKERADAELMKRGLVADLSGLLTLTSTGMRVRTGLLL